MSPCRCLQALNRSYESFASTGRGVAEKASVAPSPSPIARPLQAAAEGVVGPFADPAGDADTGRQLHSSAPADAARGVNQQPRSSRDSEQHIGPLGHDSALHASVAPNGGAYTRIGELVEGNAKLISGNTGADVSVAELVCKYDTDASARGDRSSHQESRFEPESTADFGRSNGSGATPIARRISSSGFTPSDPPSRRGSVVLTKSQLLREAYVAIFSSLSFFFFSIVSG